MHKCSQNIQLNANKTVLIMFTTECRIPTHIFGKTGEGDTNSSCSIFRIMWYSQGF